MVPFLPIIEEGQEPFSILTDLWIKHRDWVFEPLYYSSLDALVGALDKEIIEPAEARFDTRGQEGRDDDGKACLAAPCAALSAVKPARSLHELVRQSASGLPRPPLEAALKRRNKYISPVLLELGWRGKRIWSTTTTGRRASPLRK